MADPMQTLLRLRRLAVDEARLALAESIREEIAAEAAIAAARLALTRETAAAGALPPQDRGRDAFVAWWRLSQDHRLALDLRQNASAARTGQARAALAGNRSAAEAVRELLLQNDARRAADRARREQLTLDEAARRPGTPRRAAGRW